MPTVSVSALSSISFEGKTLPPQHVGLSNLSFGPLQVNITCMMVASAYPNFIETTRLIPEDQISENCPIHGPKGFTVRKTVNTSIPMP